MSVSTIAYTEIELKEIQEAYESLLASITTPMNQEDFINIYDAYILARDAHEMQVRKSGERYIFHPIAVAKICAEEIELGPTSIICALLHDVVEDTPITLEELHERFGANIAMIVDGLTKLDGAVSTSSPQAENFKKILSTLVKDVRVVLIKMADRLHNMRTLGSMPRDKQLKIASETSYIYAPLSHRLGLYQFKEEFQDLCMKITNPEPYFSIAKKLQATKIARNEYIENFIAPLKVLLNELNVPYRIIGRPKSIFSIWNKLKTKDIPFEEIYDLFAIRIIANVDYKLEKRVCWQMYSIVTDVHKPIPERLKDWITTPKSNGYESLHTTVVGPKGRFVEVQIRSERMDEIAEKGFAAHWKYKGVTGQENVYEKWLDTIRELLDHQNNDAVEFLTDFKTNLFNEEIFVYTPKGDMKILPKGATALDFAFEIHTDIGFHCTSILVNNKLVPMGYTLENGDRVSVNTSSNQKPSKSWLNMVITGKARSKIRSSMKDQKRLDGRIGRESLERKLKNMKAHMEPNIEFLVKHFKQISRIDLFYGIAQGEIELKKLKEFDVVAGILSYKKEEVEVIKTKPERAPSDDNIFAPSTKAKEGGTRLMINNEDASMYDFSLSTCCNPVKGDLIFAYLTTNQGMKIHRTTCPNATNLLANYGYRILKAEWVDSSYDSFETELVVTGVDSGKGVIGLISNMLSVELGINIRSLHIDGNQGYFEAKITIFVKNKNQLNVAIKHLEDLDVVSTVSRNK